MANDKFNKILRKLRKDKKMTQKDLASKLDVARTTLANYEQGTRFPDKETLLLIADFFGVSLDYLVGRSPADKIKKAISGDEDLQDIWEQISQRENLQLLFKQTKDLDDSTIRQIMRIIKAIEDEEQANQ